MAVALSLLIVLPGLAQDITDGKQGNGVISVGVFDDIADAQMAKLQITESGYQSLTPIPYIPAENPSHETSFGTQGEVGINSPAYLADRRVDPQNTFFRNVLYVSNDNVNDEAANTDDDTPRNAAEGAYNTVLINVKHPGPLGD